MRCNCCGERLKIDDAYECDTCKKLVCGECISYQGNSPDDIVAECIDCEEKRVD